MVSSLQLGAACISMFAIPFAKRFSSSQRDTQLSLSMPKLPSVLNLEKDVKEIPPNSISLAFSPVCIQLKTNDIHNLLLTNIYDENFQPDSCEWKRIQSIVQSQKKEFIANTLYEIYMRAKKQESSQDCYCYCVLLHMALNYSNCDYSNAQTIEEVDQYLKKNFADFNQLMSPQDMELLLLAPKDPEYGLANFLIGASSTIYQLFKNVSFSVWTNKEKMLLRYLLFYASELSKEEVKTFAKELKIYSLDEKTREVGKAILDIINAESYYEKYAFLQNLRYYLPQLQSDQIEELFGLVAPSELEIKLYWNQSVAYVRHFLKNDSILIGPYQGKFGQGDAPLSNYLIAYSERKQRLVWAIPIKTPFFQWGIDFSGVFLHYPKEEKMLYFDAKKGNKVKPNERSSYQLKQLINNKS